MFLLDQSGQELWKEERITDGWLTIVEAVSRFWADAPDYILAYRRGEAVLPALYDGYMNIVAEFAEQGYAVHGDLLGSGTEQVIIYTDELAAVYAGEPLPLQAVHPGRPQPQPKRLYSSTLYPGGEVAL
jgi:hypothetical protein